MPILQKTSDRLLVAMVAGAALLTCCIHLALYAEFHQGHILTIRQLQESRFVRRYPHRPAIISLTGTVWVNFFPSDSFYVELPKQNDPADKPWLTGQVGPEENLPVPQYRESGDTLVITGYFTGSLHRPYAEFAYSNHLPVVNIYGRDFREIRLLDGQMAINGSAVSIGAPAIRLSAINSTVWIADYNERNPTILPKEFFDSVNLHLSNSYVLLNRSAIIRSAAIQLDGSSELDDRWSTTGHLEISAADSSHINLTGINLKHASIGIH
jgi:hypothetical protein